MTNPLPPQLHELTSLRFFAAWAVVHVHLPRGTLPRFMEEQAWSAGHLGVDLFFVLSGFIMAHAYPFILNRPLDYRDFLRKRFARVMPLHIFLCLLFAFIFAINGIVGQPLNPGYAIWPELPVHLFAVHSIGTVGGHAWNYPSWSISAEMIAYTTFPIFMLCARKMPAWIYLLLTLAFLVGVYLLLQANGLRLTRMTFDYGVIRAILGFAIGIGLRNVVANSSTLSSCAPIGFTATLALVMLAISLRVSDLVVLLLLPALIGFGAGLSLSEKPTVLRHRWLVWLGERSFAVYMVHALIILLTPFLLTPLGLSGSRVATYVVNMAIIVFAAHLLYRYVECPARDWLRSRPNTEGRTPAI